MALKLINIDLLMIMVVTKIIFHRVSWFEFLSGGASDALGRLVQCLERKPGVLKPRLEAHACWFLGVLHWAITKDSTYPTMSSNARFAKYGI